LSAKPAQQRDLVLTLSSATFLTPKERTEVQRRLQDDGGHLVDDFDMKYVYQALKDWKIYIFMIICMAGFCPIYSFALFLPTGMLLTLRLRMHHQLTYLK